MNIFFYLRLFIERAGWDTKFVDPCNAFSLLISTFSESNAPNFYVLLLAGKKSLFPNIR